MRPRSLGKIVVGTLCVVCILTALIYAIHSPPLEDIYRSLRGITYGVLALTFATLYRYFED
jgi:hypothetical protein